MRRRNILDRPILLIMLVININVGHAQSFYKDFVKYQDVHSKATDSMSKSRLHSIHKQFSMELKRLFQTVKRKTAIDMLNCDTIYIVQIHPSFYSGGYTELVWNGEHSCYYENLRFSLVENDNGAVENMQADAHEKLKELGPTLKGMIQKTDTAGFRKYIFSSKMPFPRDEIRFMVGTKANKGWHFFSSRTYALVMPE